MTQTVTPELRQWIIEQSSAGCLPEAVLASMVQAGWRPDGPGVVNSSRAILYASGGADFAAAAAREANRTREALEAARG
jgi:hypothetical protein